MNLNIDNKKRKGYSVAWTIRLPKERFVKLETLAKKNKISFNHLAMQYICFALENLEEE